MSAGWWCESAWLDGSVRSGVLVTADGGRISDLQTGVERPAGVPALAGIVLPGLANGHSHAFHRALRGRTQRGRGSFWTWREQMYAVADRLDPDSYRRLATAVYAEMALAGITAVGEFHYLHHGPGGRPYDDPNAMGYALADAARAAGIRLTLLDTCYLTGGVGRPLDGVQLRFGDGDADRWAQRAADLGSGVGRSGGDVLVGCAVHSVRGVPAEQIPVVAAAAAGRPLHVHLSEQPAENDACLAAYGATPAAVLANAGALGPDSTAVHATHLTRGDLALLGGSGTGGCLCPTTERDLADGVGPARSLLDAGSPLSLGSDSHAVIDLFEEARAVELDERLVSGVRGRHTAEELLAAATEGGHRALGRPDGGRIAVGAPADLVAVRTDSVRTAGTGRDAAAVVFAATAADVTDVLVGGRAVVAGGRHLLVPDVGAELAAAIGAAGDD